MVVMRFLQHFLPESTDNCKDLEFAKRVFLLTTEENTVQMGLDKIVPAGENSTPCKVSNIFKLYQVQYEVIARLEKRINPTYRYAFSE